MWKAFGNFASTHIERIRVKTDEIELGRERKIGSQKPQIKTRSIRINIISESYRFKL
jgi:hypothetical protein